jgi:tRNA uridine 5-carboxymethylaminomethyl modification enzyme
MVSIASPEIWDLFEIETKYEGYVAKQAEQNQVMARREQQRIPDGFDFTRVAGLRSETRQKLAAIRPSSLGQAARISGITPADVSIISIWLSRNGLHHAASR